jgi:hypothetical protein
MIPIATRSANQAFLIVRFSTVLAWFAVIAEVFMIGFSKRSDLTVSGQEGKVYKRTH